MTIFCRAKKIPPYMEGEETIVTPKMSTEARFQSSLISKLRKRFEGCVILKNDANYIQGIPDLLILYRDRWAALECKRSSRSPHRPNQDYYVELLNRMSFAAFIYPENEEEILNAMEHTFGA